MRVVIQRVKSGSVSVNDEIVGQITRGLVCLIGIGRDDTLEDAEYCARKILNVRLWPDPVTGAPWKSSVSSNNYDVLLVSQFTLHGYFQGNKPDYHLAMPPEPAQDFFNAFCDRVRQDHSKSTGTVATGIFGAMMDVSLINDGPVTLLIDSKQRKPIE